MVINGLNHIGLSVADLDRSLGFYRDVLGMEVVTRGKFEGPHYEAILGLPGSRGEAASLRLGTLGLELFEFSEPVPSAGEADRPVSDRGITHFCLEVTDIHREYERLRSAGVRFHCAPLEFFGIARATYGRDPDGNVFELLEWLPAGGSPSLDE